MAVAPVGKTENKREVRVSRAEPPMVPGRHGMRYATTKLSCHPVGPLLARPPRPKERERQLL